MVQGDPRGSSRSRGSGERQGPRGSAAGPGGDPVYSPRGPSGSRRGIRGESRGSKRVREGSGEISTDTGKGPPVQSAPRRSSRRRGTLGGNQWGPGGSMIVQAPTGAI